MLIPCTECGTQISDKATACPKCGASTIRTTTSPVSTTPAPIITPPVPPISTKVADAMYQRKAPVPLTLGIAFGVMATGACFAAGNVILGVVGVLACLCGIVRLGIVMSKAEVVKPEKKP